MVVYLALLCLAAERTSLSIEPAADPRQVRVVARLTPDLAKTLRQGDVEADVAQRLLSLALVDANAKPGAAIFGKYRREADLLIFTPRYALAHEQTYRATYVLSPKRTETRDYTVPARKPTPPAVIEHIYPTSDVLPANQLKVYIHFSKSMREGE